MNDPIVEEVRAIRERIAAESDFDIRKIFSRVRVHEQESQYQAARVNTGPPPAPDKQSGA